MYLIKCYQGIFQSIPLIRPLPSPKILWRLSIAQKIKFTLPCLVFKILPDGIQAHLSSLFHLPLWLPTTHSLQPEKWPTVVRTVHSISLLFFICVVFYIKISLHIHILISYFCFKGQFKTPPRELIPQNRCDLSGLWFPVVHYSCTHLFTPPASS